ncbi:MAG: MCE family protein [Bacteroidales bacterium]|nr:MCE family protein [Bacteroidales bacterium]
MTTSKITRIGLLIIIALALLIWGVNYLKGKSLFKSENTYYVVYDRVNGLNNANSVLINGFKIGQVADIRFLQDTSEHLLVTLTIESKYRIKKGAVAQIFSEDIMGTKAIQIIKSESSEFHNDGDTLISSIEGDLKEQVNMQILPLKRKAESLISSLDSAILVVRSIFNEKTQENLRRTFASIKITISNLERTTFTLDTILNSEKSKLARIFSNIDAITGNLKNNNEKLSNIINNFSSISDSIAKADIASTLHKADSALVQFNNVLKAINEGDGTINQLLNNDTLYRNIENATYNLNKLLRDMHENPKRYVHFSILDLGKTIYVEEPKEVKEKKKKKKDIEE